MSDGLLLVGLNSKDLEVGPAFRAFRRRGVDEGAAYRALVRGIDLEVRAALGAFLLGAVEHPGAVGTAQFLLLLGLDLVRFQADDVHEEGVDAVLVYLRLGLGHEFREVDVAGWALGRSGGNRVSTEGAFEARPFAELVAAPRA